MSDIAWELEHSVEAEVSVLTAWNFWTNIANWDDPPAVFELEDSFVAGSRGVTRIPGQEPIHWIIREVNGPASATIEIQLERATLSAEWRFDALAPDRTQLTQRLILRGENAAAFLPQVRSAFESNMAEGMAKIARRMARENSATS